MELLEAQLHPLVQAELSVFDDVLYRPECFDTWNFSLPFRG